ncbi:MAG: hypothetical protein VX438_00090 [Planctomycetota bacterium]|nr:hypothetical protein [Planctomycetota bacterium]
MVTHQPTVDIARRQPPVKISAQNAVFQTRKPQDPSSQANKILPASLTIPRSPATRPRTLPTHAQEASQASQPKTSPRSLKRNTAKPGRIQPGLLTESQRRSTWPSKRLPKSLVSADPQPRPRKLIDTGSVNTMPATTIPAEIPGAAPTASTIEMIDFVDEINPNSSTVQLPRSPSATLRSEILFMGRGNGSAQLTDSLEVDPFNFEMGIRINAQRQMGVDAINLTYSGIQEWNDVGRTTSATGSLNIDPVGLGMPSGSLTPFTDANFQEHYHHGNLHTLELNKVTWGWDVLNLFWGFRFTHYEEELSFFSSRSDGQTGLLDLDYENNLFGPQIGGEVFYDTGRLLSFGIKTKLGLLGNAFESTTQLYSNGARHLNNGDSDFQLNVMAELGVFGRLRIGPQAFLRCGYEMWYNSSVVGIDDNLPAILTPDYGKRMLDSDLFIHGGTLGLELLW